MCGVITRELVGISRGDASVAPTGVGGCLEAWITCGDKVSVSISLITLITECDTWTGKCHSSSEVISNSYVLLVLKRNSQCNRCVLLCCPITVKLRTVCDISTPVIWFSSGLNCLLSLSAHYTEVFFVYNLTPGELTSGQHPVGLQ